MNLQEQITRIQSMMGIINENNSYIIESFVFFILDQRELVFYEKEVEEAKKKSEFLLYQILPRDIVLSLNQSDPKIFAYIGVDPRQDNVRNSSPYNITRIIKVTLFYYYNNN